MKKVVILLIMVVVSIGMAKADCEYPVHSEGPVVIEPIGSVK